MVGILCLAASLGRGCSLALSLSMVAEARRELEIMVLEAKIYCMVVLMSPSCLRASSAEAATMSFRDSPWNCSVS